MGKLTQKTVYENPGLIAANYSLGNQLQQMHPAGTFPLVEDPKKTKKTSIIGMFVLRPAYHAWKAPVLDTDGTFSSAYKPDAWTFNLRGFDGGWLIANGNHVDAYRLALQYGLADAVLVGSATVAKEGVAHNGKPGYIWQPQGPTQWTHLKEADPTLFSKIMKERMEWQADDRLSQRLYPAQIVVSQSGKHEPGSNDILQAAIFSETSPDKKPIEVYILTSEAGAERLRSRAPTYGLQSRIDDILIPLSPPGNPEMLDLARVPHVLYTNYDIRIANHDGGARVLSEFSKAGILPQINLTLSRSKSLHDVIQTTTALSAEDRTKAIALMADLNNVQQFFSHGYLPRALKPVQVITDDNEDVAVVAFDARELRGL